MLRYNLVIRKITTQEFKICYTDIDAAGDLQGEYLLYEFLMEKATEQQCIYLFVEGESEEIAFPILLDGAGIVYYDIGLKIANYNGIGNLKHALRLLNNTLSNDRPVIVTYDNDEDGTRVVKQISNNDYNNDLIRLFPIPSVEKVIYNNNHKGGSFEEIFTPKYFIDCCFSEAIMNTGLINKKKEFLIIFDKKKPWFNQVKKYCAQNGYFDFSSKKTALAENLACNCERFPRTIISLVSLIKKVRKEYPVTHPEHDFYKKCRYKYPSAKAHSFLV